MLSSPCKNCDDREPYGKCHDHCIAYKQWKAKHMEIKIKMHEDEKAHREMEGRIHKKIWG